MKKLLDDFLLEFFLDLILFSYLLYHQDIGIITLSNTRDKKISTRMDIITKKRLRHAKIVSTLIFMMPYVRCVILNGSLAQGKSKVSSDIDFLIICRRKRIFTARFFCMLITWISGLKRSSDESSDHSGLICLNYFMTDDNLIIPHNRSEEINKYCAQNYSQSILLKGDKKIFVEYLAKNILWMKKYLDKNRLESMASKIEKHGEGDYAKEKLLEKFLNKKFGDSLERIIKNIQIKRIQKDTRTVRYPQLIVINDKELRFHPPKKKYK